MIQYSTADGRFVTIVEGTAAASGACLHCWHPYVGAWSGTEPALVHCCWCGMAMAGVPVCTRAHGPYAGGTHA
jgi:hypothetical protein